jgi:hypothetical protein
MIFKKVTICLNLYVLCNGGGIMSLVKEHAGETQAGNKVDKSRKREQ